MGSNGEVGQAVRCVLMLTLRCLCVPVLTSTAGPIYSLNFLGKPAIVISNHQVAADLLDKRSAIYSDRPRLIMTGEVLSGKLFFAFLSYGTL